MRDSELLPLTPSREMLQLQIEGLHPAFVLQSTTESTHIPRGMHHTRSLLPLGMDAPALPVAMPTFTEIRRGPQQLFLCLTMGLIATRSSQPTA